MDLIPKYSTRKNLMIITEDIAKKLNLFPT